MRHDTCYSYYQKSHERVSFCFEQCDREPTVRIGGEVIHVFTAPQAIAAIREAVIKPE
jgi:hypothetical protein